VAGKAQSVFSVCVPLVLVIRRAIVAACFLRSCLLHPKITTTRGGLTHDAKRIKNLSYPGAPRPGVWTFGEATPGNLCPGGRRGCTAQSGFNPGLCCTTCRRRVRHSSRDSRMPGKRGSTVRTERRLEAYATIRRRVVNCRCTAIAPGTAECAIVFPR
jgi:hypothetical protein